MTHTEHDVFRLPAPAFTVDELAAILPNRDAWKMERVRAALSRRRSAAVAPSFGFSGRTFEYSLRSAPVLATVDEEAMTITNVALETYERELTRQLERYAAATFERIVRAAELREEMGKVSNRIIELYSEIAHLRAARAEGRREGLEGVH